jgi:hypothetical protein
MLQPTPFYERDASDPCSLFKLSSHLPFGRAVYLRPTKPHALGDGSLEPGFDPLPNHRALELSKGSGGCVS